MRMRLALILLCLMSGCNNSPPNPQAERTDLEKDSAAERLQLIKKTEKFNDDLTSLNKLASKYEGDSQYTKAAAVRSQIRQLIVENLGESSWQAFNAGIAYERAYRKSGFTVEQQSTDRKIKRLVGILEALIKRGELQQATELSSELVRLTSELFGEESIDMAQTLIQIANLETRVKKYEQAVGHFHKAIELYRKHQFGNHPELESAHSSLAMAYVRLAELTPAAANQKEAVRIAGQVWGRESLEFAKQANQLGVVFHRAGNLEVAFEILDRARKIRENQLGTDHVAYAHSCLNLGVLLMDLSRPDNAEQYLKRALVIFERDFGTDQALTNRAKSNLATIFMLRKQPDLAEPLLKDVVAAHTENSDDWLTHQYRLSVAYAKQGKYQLAKPIMETVFKQQKVKYGQSDDRTVTTMKAYALLLDRTHQTDAANTIKQHIERVAHQTETNAFQKRY